MSQERRVVVIDQFELTRVAQGRVMGVRTLDGEEVNLRLATADELIEFNRQARESLSEQMGHSVGMSLARDMAEALARPLGS